MTNSHPNKVTSAYAKHVHYYDRRWQRYIDSTLRVALEVLQLDGTEKILDVACGTGELERRIVAQFPTQAITGVDLSDEMLTVAREKLREASNVRFEHADSHYLPYPDSHYDIVITCSAFHYMHDPQKVVAEFARVVRPGGRVIILDWCRNHWIGKGYNIFRRLFVPSHYHVYTTRELEHLIRDAGLTHTSTRRFHAYAFWRMMVGIGVRP